MQLKFKNWDVLLQKELLKSFMVTCYNWLFKLCRVKAFILKLLSCHSTFYQHNGLGGGRLLRGGRLSERGSLINYNSC